MIRQRQCLRLLARSLQHATRMPVYMPPHRGFAGAAARARQHHREFDEDGPYARAVLQEAKEAEALAELADEELVEEHLVEEEDYDEFDEFDEFATPAESEEDPIVYESLASLSNSGKIDGPILPIRPLMYELPYSIEGYRTRHRVWEGTGTDPDDTSSSSGAGSLFTDIKILKLGSGKGGDGKVSFFRDSGRSKGPPDGGDGGEGGAVYIQAVAGETSLHKLRYHYRSEDGRPGSMAGLNGRAGKDTLLQVPVGTVVRWIPDPKESYEAWKAEKEKMLAAEWDLSEAGAGPGKKKLVPNLRVRVDAVMDEYDRAHALGIKLPRAVYADGEGWIFRDKDEAYQSERAYFLQLRDRVKRHDRTLRAQEEGEDYFPIEGLDLSKPGPPLLLLRGGRGGLGNTHFHTQLIRNPRFCKRGRSGVTSFFLLELKLLADLGLVGLPNAGKSTLLRAISRARPRVGHWEFTTLRPTVGTISLGFARPAFTVADIPGIVEGARALNRGMGLDFLRHVERSGGLVFVISLETRQPRQPSSSSSSSTDTSTVTTAEAPQTGHSVVDDLDLLVSELGPDRMHNKQILVVGTKADLPGSEAQFAALKHVCDERGWACVPCCAERKENVEAVIEKMGRTAGKA